MKKFNKTIFSTTFAVLTALSTTGVTALTAQAATATDASHVRVEAGDTYKSIAETQGVKISDLEQANGRQVGGFDIIYPGETVTLPGASTVQAQPVAQSTQSVQTPQATQSQTQAQTPQTSGTSQGTFKISYYDPAVLGSSMGYGGVAANLSVFPKGTQLKITMADGTVMYRIVNDTGTFAYSNPHQLDVAMPNNQIPSSGISTATVEVI